MFCQIETLSGGAENQANALRSEILCSDTTQSRYDITGKIYHISPNGSDENDGLTPLTPMKTLHCRIFTEEILENGDAVLFECGGVWRTADATVTVKNGVVFGSYGKGKKPCIFGSACNYAKEREWKEFDKNIWGIPLPYPNAGIVIFDNDTLAGFKKFGYLKLRSNGDFYHDTENGVFYLYSTADPSDAFESIEIGRRGHILYAEDNTVIDGLCLKYTGSHGIFAGFCKNIKVTNCEIGFIGGAEQMKDTRFGNGIEFGMGAEDILVDKCYVYQCFDAGVSFQAWDSNNKPFINITFSNLLIEYCQYAIEFFDRECETAVMKNITFSGNCLRFSGDSWGQKQRFYPDQLGGHIRVAWPNARWYKNIENFRISDNIFDIGHHPFVLWNFGCDKPETGMLISNNIFYSKKIPSKNCEIWYGKEGIPAAFDQASLAAAVNIFDKSPRSVEWLF